MTKKLKFWLFSAAFTFSTLISPGVIDIHSAAAAPNKESKPTSLMDKLIFFFRGGANKNQPRVSAAGRRTRVAGSRDGCKTDVAALIPNYNLGVTMSTNPNFWFYIPTSSSNAEYLKFTVLNREQKEVWQTELPVTSKKLKSGLLKLPYQGQPLTDGAYQWEFSYKETGCDLVLLSGKVQKESHPNLIVGKTPQKRLRIYAQNGIWYELLTELITLRQQQPKDSRLAADFRSLIFESETIKYYLPKSSLTDSNIEDRDLMEKILKSQVID